ncbi:Domain of unknown function DUF4190 [Acidimicrobiia bacterium]
MSDTSQGPGWWIASDGKWYPPESAQPPTPPPPAPPAYTPPPAYPPAAYAPPPYAPPMGSVAPTAQEALWAMILGIASLVCCGFILGIPAIILGSNAKKKIASSGGTLGGEGMAKAGVILGWISVGLSIVGIAFWVLAVLLGSSTSSGYYDY